MNYNTVLQNPNLDGAALQDLLDARSRQEVDFLLIDVREMQELAEGYIKGCDRHCPTSDFMGFVPDLQNASKPIVFYCRSGGRTSQVLSYLDTQGFSDICHLAGGIMGYGGELAHDAHTRF